MINDCSMDNLGIQALSVPSLGPIKIYVCICMHKHTRLSWLTRVRPRRVNHHTHIHTLHAMTAIFNFQSLLLVVLLLICTATYTRAMMPRIIDRSKTGVSGIPWKAARIGERMSPYVSICCVIMALRGLYKP